MVSEDDVTKLLTQVGVKPAAFVACSGLKGDNVKNKSDKILDFVRKKGSADAMELIKKFGEKGVDDLIKRGDLIEERGVVKVLE